MGQHIDVVFQRSVRFQHELRRFFAGRFDRWRRWALSREETSARKNGKNCGVGTSAARSVSARDGVLFLIASGSRCEPIRRLSCLPEERFDSLNLAGLFVDCLPME